MRFASPSVKVSVSQIFPHAQNGKALRKKGFAVLFICLSDSISERLPLFQPLGRIFKLDGGAKNSPRFADA